MPPRNIAITVAALGMTAALFGWLSSPNRRPAPGQNRIVRIATSQTGAWLAAGTASGRVAVWNLRAAPPAVQFHAANGRLNDLRFSPGEQWLAIADRGLTLLPVGRSSAPLILRNDGGNYGSVRFSPAGESILTINGGGRIEILATTTGKTLAGVCCSTIAGAAFTPDGRSFLSAGHLPSVWDVQSGTLLKRLTPNRQFMTLVPIAFRAGQLLMGSQDGGIHLWDWRTFQSLEHRRNRRIGSIPSPCRSEPAWSPTRLTVKCFASGILKRTSPVRFRK